MSHIITKTRPRLWQYQHENKAEAGKGSNGITLVNITSLQGKEYLMSVFPFQLLIRQPIEEIKTGMLTQQSTHAIDYTFVIIAKLQVQSNYV